MGIKNIILKKFENFLQNNIVDITKDELEISLYGLEVVYSLITKTLLFFIISLILNYEKEFLHVVLVLIVVRSTSFGYHADKEITCYISSFLVIFGTIYIAKNFNFNHLFIAITCLISIITTIIFAPADTEKRPLLNKHTRSILRLCSFMIVFFFSYVAIINVGFISNAITCILIVNSVNISPILYKIFKKRYRNYEHY